ncbi:hypothetical protein QTP86_001081 [Hemibagrus guttatus]|nr:hypothetical protein QTP86_001081 [Hemibagrus guttatus]
MLSRSQGTILRIEQEVRSVFMLVRKHRSASKVGQGLPLVARSRMKRDNGIGHHAPGAWFAISTNLDEDIMLSASDSEELDVGNMERTEFELPPHSVVFKSSWSWLCEILRENKGRDPKQWETSRLQEQAESPCTPHTFA